MKPDDKQILYRIIPAGLLFVGWFVLVLLGRTDVGPFIGAVQAALIGMGIYHTTKSPPGDKP